MKKPTPLWQKVNTVFRQKRMFWRILAMYLASSIFFLTIFSAVLTLYLTRRATRETISRNNESLGQAYATADYILNMAYETYYKIYQSSEATSIMFDSELTIDNTLVAAKLFKRINSNIDCVESFYFINCVADRVCTSDGRITTRDDFYDTQALRLFQFYNENSDTLFLPRKTSFIDTTGLQREHCFISLIFSRRNAFMIPVGGMVVNLDENELIKQLTGDLETPEDFYIISKNGSVLAHANSQQVNSSIYGSALWKQLTDNGDQQEFSFQTEWQGETCLVTVRNAPRLRFSFLRITPVAKIRESVTYIRNFVLLCLAVFLLVAFLLATILSQYIYQPLSNLVTNLRNNKSKILPQTNTASLMMDEVSFLGKTYEFLHSEMETLAQDNWQMVSIRRREVLRDILLGCYNEEKEYLKQLADLEITDATQYMAAVIIIDGFDEFNQKYTANDVALFRYALANITEEILENCGSGYCTEIDNNQVAVLLCVEEQDDVSTCFMEICKVAKTYLHQTVTCGIGSSVTELIDLVTSYNQAMTAASYRLVKGCGSTIVYADIANRQNMTPEYPLDIDASIVQALRSCSAKKAVVELERFFSYFFHANIDTINMGTIQLAISLSRTVHSMAAAHEGTRKLPNYRVLTASLGRCDTLEQRKSLLKDYCGKVIEIRSYEIQTKKEKQIESIKEFIKINYSNPMLSTEDIAAYAELSPNYLRTVFKNSTGKSPTKYLADYRLEQAMELLVSTDRSTKDVANAVGYYNHRYFYSVFKAKTGMTATEYRKSQQKGLTD